MTRILSLFLWTFWITSLTTHAQVNLFNWYISPYGNKNFNINATFGSDIMIECADDFTRNMTADLNFAFWILPDLTTLDTNNSCKEFSTIDGKSSWCVAEDGNMTITNLEPEHFGFYYCILTGDELEVDGRDVKQVVVKKGVNYDGPYWGDRWPEYEMNVIVGCSAAGGLLLLVIICSIVHSLFFSGGEGPEDPDASIPSTSSEGTDRKDDEKDEKKSPIYTMDDIDYGLDNGDVGDTPHGQSNAAYDSTDITTEL